MQSLSPSQLQELESVLTQLHTDSTLNNEQRSQLEKWLNDRYHINHCTNSWQIGLELVSHHTRQLCSSLSQSSTTSSLTQQQQQQQMIQQFQQQKLHIMWYGLHLLENCIVRNHKVWQSDLTVHDKHQIKSIIVQQLIPQYKIMHVSIWTKLCTLLVHIARMEWPDCGYPDFINQVLQFCCSQDTILVGLTLLLSISEEFSSLDSSTTSSSSSSSSSSTSSTGSSSGRSDLPAARKTKLRNDLLSGEMTRILDFLGQLLSTLWEQHGRATQFRNAPPELVHIVQLALKCVAHFLTWIPIERFLKVELLDILAIYASVPCQESIRIQALTCYTEVLAKPFVASTAESLMLKCYHQMCQMIASFISGHTASTPSGANSGDVDGDYLEKLCLMQHFFVLNHLRRVESSNLALQFLTLMYQFTFNIEQLSPEQLTLCVQSLESFLDHLKSRSEAMEASTFAQYIAQYSEVMSLFMNATLNMCIFSNKTRESILELDNLKVDSHDQTELDHFLNTCVEVVVLICELYFEKSLSSIHALFGTVQKQFTELDKGAMPVMVNRASIDDMSTGERHVFSCGKNLITVMRIYGQLNDKFVEHFDATMNVCSSYISAIISIQMSLLGSMIHQKATIMSQLSNEVFISLQMFHPWMKEFSNRDALRGEFEKLIVVIFDSFVKCLDPATNATTDTLNGCTGLMLTMFYNFGNLPLTELAQYRVIMQNLPQLTQFLSSKFQFSEFEPIAKRLYAALSNSILLKQTSQTPVASLIEWQKQNYEQFIACYLKQQFSNVLVFLQNNQFNDPTVLNTLPILITIAKSIVDSVHDKSKLIKTIVHENLKFLIDNILNLFKVYMQTPHILNLLLGLMLNIFNSLSTQVGFEFIQQTVESFLDLFTRETLQQCVIDPNGRTVIISFLDLLNALMSEGSSRFLSMTDKVVTICQNVIFPVIMPSNAASYLSAKTSIDILLKYSSLMHTILHSNWKYFFDMRQEPTSQHAMSQFMFIMQCFLQNFQLPDIDVFRETIKLLEQLNTSRKLYSRDIFISRMMSAFLKVLFDVLVAKSHALIQEDIILIICHIVDSSGTVFESNFLPNYLSSLQSGQNTKLSQQQQVTLSQYFLNTESRDPVRFSHNVSSFTNDVRYYLSNSVTSA